MEKYYWNLGYLLSVFIIYLLAYLISTYIFQPMFHSESWIVFCSFIFLSIILVYSTKMFPIVVKVGSERVVFYGVLWRYVFKRAWLEEIIVDTGGFIFKPTAEYEHRYKRLAEISSGRWKGYKVVAFLNPKGLRDFIKYMYPITGDRIDWNKMSEKRRKLWWDAIYGTKV